MMVIPLRLSLLAATTCYASSWTEALVDTSTLLHSDGHSYHSAERALEFGDYAEVPETCPAMTTCPIVCVASIDDCPTSCEEGKVLCNDGRCDISCTGDEETACVDRCESMTITCPKVVDFYDACKEKYETFYDAESLCIASQTEMTPQVSFTGPWFLFCYFWISGVTGLVVLWCFFNQKLAPIKTSTIPMSELGWSQTGYKRHWLGIIIHGFVMLTLFGIQVLLLILVILYYMQQGVILKQFEPVFQDEVQELFAFELVWFIGFLWSFAFRWPISIQSLFLRRCTLDQATHVAITSRAKQIEVEEAKLGETLLSYMMMPFDCIMHIIFSYPYNPPGFDVTFCEVSVDSMTGTRFLYHRMCRYVFNEESAAYESGSMNVGKTFEEFLLQAKGLSSEEAERRLHIVGHNMIPMSKPTVLGNIGKEFGKVFYLYQNFMVWTWAPYWYYYMAVVQTIVRVTGGIIVGVFQYMSDSVLYQISHVEGFVKVLRDDAAVSISVGDLVPGDVVVLDPGPVYCDMVIIKADHLVVDESALTGEATPIVKVAVDQTMKEEIYDVKYHKANTVSAGTSILECGEDQQELGLVLTTGPFTTKGKLLSDVLSYRRHKFKFDDEVKIVLFILLLEGIFLVTMVFHFLQDQFVYAFFYGIFVLGTVIPPLLPTVFVVSVGISAHRLRKRQITCTYPEGILIAGKVNAAFFDKTGTLTEVGMSFVGVRCDEQMSEQVTLGMALCHGLKLSGSGEILGNQVDHAAFLSTGAELHFQKGENVLIKHRGKNYTIVRQNEFDNHRATQSVVIRDERGSLFVFVKGSPEAIHVLCDATTIPEEFEDTVRSCAKSGSYQLALAQKNLDPAIDFTALSRDLIESSLSFCGFINFQNRLKSDTPEVMRELQRGKVSITMITGDNVLTGICIAREAGIIEAERSVLLGRKAGEYIEWINVDNDEIAKEPTAGSNIDLSLTGEAWRAVLTNDPKHAREIAGSVRVFGRCNPVDKVSVVTTFVELGYKTLMCGDGQNDCGALKSAHVGVALSSSEASVVAPFTSLNKTITSVTEVLREGRCALSAAFKVYSYYIIYGQTESYLQSINAYLFITFTEWCWVFMDGFWSTLMAFSLPLASAAMVLSPNRPTASLLGPRTMFSACGLLAWNFLYLAIALLTLYRQDWFQCRKWDSEDVSNVLTIGDNYESSVLFIVGGYQYIASAIALNFGYTWRCAWYKNYLFIALATLYTAMQFVMTLYPSSFSCIWRVNCENDDVVRWVTTKAAHPINNPFNTTVMPVEFRWIMIYIMLANLITLCAWEYLFVNGYLYKMFDFKGRPAHAKPLETAEAEGSVSSEDSVPNEIFLKIVAQVISGFASKFVGMWFGSN